jgi:hypothetical protein
VSPRVAIELLVRFTANTAGADGLESHRWEAWITLDLHHDPTPDADAVVRVRDAVQAWVDTHLHRGTLLADGDPWVEVHAHHGLRHFVVGVDEHSHDLPHPSVVAVGEILRRVAVTYVQRVGLAATASRVTISDGDGDGARVHIASPP